MPFNQGQLYEQDIRNILKSRNLLPSDLKGNDAGFIRNHVDYFIEVKNKIAHDFGQKRVNYDPLTKQWSWGEKDIVTDLYDAIGVIGKIKDFEPRKYTVPTDRFTKADKIFDQGEFKQNNITLDDTSYLYEFYARKGCYYIQIEGKGFYYLKTDAAALTVPQFKPELNLRLRAKTHHSTPAYDYSFMVVLETRTKDMLASPFDLEGKVGAFPSI